LLWFIFQLSMKLPHCLQQGMQMVKVLVMSDPPAHMLPDLLLRVQLWRVRVQRNYSVLFTPTFKLVSGLLRAKRDYELERELRRLDRFQVVILDDLGYVQQTRGRWKSYSLFWLSDMNAAASLLPPIWPFRNGIRPSRTP